VPRCESPVLNATEVAVALPRRPASYFLGVEGLPFEAPIAVGLTFMMVPVPKT